MNIHMYMHMHIHIHIHIHIHKHIHIHIYITPYPVNRLKHRSAAHIHKISIDEIYSLPGCPGHAIFAMKYSYCSIVLDLCLVILSVRGGFVCSLKHILCDCIANTEAIIPLSQWQWNHPDGYGWNKCVANHKKIQESANRICRYVVGDHWFCCWHKIHVVLHWIYVQYF